MTMELDNYSLNPTLLHSGIAVHDGDWNWKRVRSPFARIYYVSEGEAEILFHRPHSGKVGDRTQRLTAGNLYLVPPFTTHTNRCEGRFVHFYAHVDYPADLARELFEEYRFAAEVKAGPIDAELFRRLCHINADKRLPASDPRSYDNPETLRQMVARSHANRLSVRLETIGILNQLLSRFLENAAPATTAGDKRISQVLKHIRRNLQENITIDAMAEMTCLSKDHFIRLFKSECGQSPLQYINHRKVELAETLLATTDQSIKQIADRLSFSDSSYFTRLFHKITGTTPAAYRRKVANL